jgi:hypothetical protein
MVAPLGPRLAGAQGDVAIRWSACEGAGALNLQGSCGSNAAVDRLVLSIRPQADLSQVVGWALVVDIAVDANPIPSWWELQAGGCRAGQLIAGTPNGSEGPCTDAWSANGSAAVQSILYPRPGGDGSQLRLIVGMSVPSPAAFAMTAGQSYLAAVVELRHANTAGVGSCPGCSTAACLVFNSAEVEQLPDPGSPLRFVTPLLGIGNQITWYQGMSCASVPVRSRTWGQLKALYR